MNKKYTHFLTQNPQHLWFKRKPFGWGWTPVTWQGWGVVALYVLVILLSARNVDEYSSGSEVLLTCIAPVILSTILLIYTCYKTGEKPRWQWGDWGDKS